MHQAREWIGTPRALFPAYSTPLIPAGTPSRALEAGIPFAECVTDITSDGRQLVFWYDGEVRA